MFRCDSNWRENVVRYLTLDLISNFEFQLMKRYIDNSIKRIRENEQVESEAQCAKIFMET